jgi:hypothetical protein
MPTTEHMADLLHLFEFDKKNLLEKYCKKLTVYSNDFANLIYWADNGDFKFDHNCWYREIVPSDLQSTLDSLPNIHDKQLSHTDQSRIIRRLVQVIRVRRQLVIHMFFNKDITQWYYFYFDQHETSVDDNHWKFGPHMHLINHLFTNRDPVLILKEFLNDKPNINDGFHIRFIDKELLK